MAVDFIMDILNSNSYNTILVTIYQFSKACRLIPLKGLPMTMETAMALFHQVFRMYSTLCQTMGPSLPLMSGRLSAANLASM